MRLRFLLFFCFLGPTLSWAADHFSKGYGGAFATYGYTTARFNAQKFKGKSLSFGILGGFGSLFNKAYVGAELEGDRGTFNKTYATESLKRKGALGAYLKLGRPIHENFLPFVRMGVKYDFYELKTAQRPKNTFQAIMVSTGVGVDASINNSFNIRSMVSYDFCTGFRSLKSISPKKPRHYSLMMAFIYKV